MVPTFPLFPGLPGGPELLIVLFVMVLVLGIPTLLVAAAAFFGVRYVRGGDTREERIAELEREVRELRERAGRGRAADELGGFDASSESDADETEFDGRER